jgi:hypothetical protein
VKDLFDEVVKKMPVFFQRVGKVHERDERAFLQIVIKMMFFERGKNNR